MKDRKWGVFLALWLAWSLMACRSAVKDFYEPLTKPAQCGGSGGRGGNATGGQTSAAAGGAGTGGHGGECP